MNLRMWSLAAALFIVSTTIATAQSNESAAPTTLVGTWAVEVTLRNCATNAPIGPAFRSLVTFHRGGTLSESAASLSFAVGQRTAGHGTWASAQRHAYDQEMIALILFDTAANLPGTPGFDPTKPVTPGFFAGWQTVSHTVRLVDGDHLESEGTNAFYKANGDLYRSGCSTAVGQRFE